MGDISTPPDANGTLHRHFGLLHATALNVSMIVGAGVFAVIPAMVVALPGPYALLGWLGAGLLIIVDGQIWSELGAMMPGSGGSYLYLLEAFGPKRWGRLTAFLFIWQFLFSGPLEIASGLIAMAVFSSGLYTPEFKAEFVDKWTVRRDLVKDWDLAVTIDPARIAAILLGVLILFLLYRRITSLGKMTIVVWLGVLGVIAWILIEGALHFDAATAFDFSGVEVTPSLSSAKKLGEAMILAMYSYLGYYHICYVGDEVRNPGKTIPRSILLSAVLVLVLFVALHLALLGTVSWRTLPTDDAEIGTYILAADYIRRLHPGHWAAILVTLLLIWSCFSSAFAGLLGYSRIPYGAARYGHFFRFLGRVHPKHRIPHVALFAVGGLTLFWVFFDLDKVITALITTRILEQFIAQVVGVLILRHTQPQRPRPFRMWLYPLPCLAALIGWVYLYCSADLLFIEIGLATLLAGIVAFLIWSRQTKKWPFATTED